MNKNRLFNEATRVQMPALVHLTRIGYDYYGKINEEMANVKYDPDTNILIEIFKEQFVKLNPNSKDSVENIIREIRQELDNDDLGRSFYNRLQSVSPIRLIDFDNPQNNVFHCTAEFTCKKDEDEFRPDITLFVNGLPLVFVEVKQPNNPGGMLAESKRMNEQRFPNKKFRRFLNLTQFMIFSNNMEYDAEGGIIPIQGAFYCTTAKKSAHFNCFREENLLNENIPPYNKNFPYKDKDDNVEYKILSDFNVQVIHTAPEYQENLDVYTPTNRILTSMCSPERLLYIIKYGIAYVSTEREVDGKIEAINEKHIMRYQQLFASLAVKNKIIAGVKSGIIWHTQGSGKTALSYYLTRSLTDLFAENNKVTKFYFIVDRLDLLEQASQEFKARGLEVKTANSREELMAQFKTNQAQEGVKGKNEITVVNIQKFADDKTKVDLPNYATNLQRIFIIDEAHRGYKPEGCFLMHLFEADPNSIKIALTGTPLLKDERASWKVFGEYLHTYYYDKSVQDGYTLKIIREDIETSYREKLSQIYEDVKTLVQKKDIRKADIIEHDNYVKELLRFIINDLKKFRILHNDNTLGGMVICETSEQARKLYSYFDEIQAEINKQSSNQSTLKAGLILFDSDDKETRKKIISQFKREMSIDILIVFNMLLTGFDAPRLKRLYFGRKLKEHNLLQAITRVNRPYKDNRYGYIIDFADIKQNFDETNQAYIQELNRFNNPDKNEQNGISDTFNQIIEDKEKIINEMNEIKQTLFSYTTDNVEKFNQEISVVDDKFKLLNLKKVLTTTRDYYNLVRTFGDDELKQAFETLEIAKIPSMISQVQKRINFINIKEFLDSDYSTKQLINQAMENITFDFHKIGEEELRVISNGDELKEKITKVSNEFKNNYDEEDPEYIELFEAFKKIFKKLDMVNTVNEYNETLRITDEIMKKLSDLKRQNDLLLKKYNGDFKFARVHKRIREENERRKSITVKPIISVYDDSILQTLCTIKDAVDQKVYDRNDILKKDAYFEQTVMTEIKNGMDKVGINGIRDDRVFIQNKISKQYLEQYKMTYDI